MEDSERQNQTSNRSQKDSASPSPKRSKANPESSNELFEAGLENDRATASSIFLADQYEVLGDSHCSRCLSHSKGACQECESHVESVIQESASFSGLKFGCETEFGKNSFETFGKMGKNLFEIEENQLRMLTDATGGAGVCNTETKAQVNSSCRDGSFAASVVLNENNSPVNDVTLSGGHLENNDSESRVHLEPGFPGGVVRDCAFCPAVSPASFACAECAAGKGLGNASQEPADVIDAAAVIESHICRQADGTGVEQMKGITSGCCSPTVAIRSESATHGPVPNSPGETHAKVFREGATKAVLTTYCEERRIEDHDNIPEKPIRLAPSSELINRIHKSDAMPSAETSPRIDGAFMNSPHTGATMDPVGTRNGFTLETEIGEEQISLNIHPSPKPTEQHWCAREELNGYDHERREEHHNVNASSASTEEYCCTKNQSLVSQPDMVHCRCEVSNLERPAPSNTERHMGTEDTVGPICENALVNAPAEERDNSVVVIESPFGSAKVESEVEETGNAAAAGWGEAATSKDIHEDGRRPPSPSPQPTLTPQPQSDATQNLVDDRHLVTPIKQHDDAVVPETEAGYRVEVLRVCPVNKTQFPAHCQCNCLPAVFDSFERIPLSLGADILEHSPHFNTSSQNSISGKPQSYYDVGGPLSEFIPMRIPPPPISDLNKDNKQLAESEYDVEHGPSRKGRVHDCDSPVVTFDQCGSHRESPSTYLCVHREEKQIPDVYFSQCPGVIEPEQSDQLPAAFAASGQICLLPESTPDDFDEQGRLGTCPQPSHLRPLTSALTLKSSQNNSTPQFEMKEKFDLVLEELSLFFSIGREAEQPASSETLYSRGAPLEDGTADRDIGPLTSPSVKARGKTIAAQNGCGNIRAVRQRPETTSSSVGFDCEQEVPLGLSHSSAEGEDSMYCTVKQKEDGGSKHWVSAFMVLPIPTEQNRGFLERARRLEPLRTCARPIRVGLSKRERPKQLHPYFK